MCGWNYMVGPIGEPALGPVAFMHRVSGLPNPIAPMTHHWFRFHAHYVGVATARPLLANDGRWKGPYSTGREPDETRTDFDFAAMDSWSGRVWLSSVLALVAAVFRGPIERG